MKNMYNLSSLVEYLKKEVSEHELIDVGTNVEKCLGVSRALLDKALMELRKDGYLVILGKSPYVTVDGKIVTMKLLCRTKMPVQCGLTAIDI